MEVDTVGQDESVKMPNVRRRKSKDVFLTRLRLLLNNPNITTVSWHPNGRAIMIDKRFVNDQVAEVFPGSFGKDKFTAIRQNLGAHGFKSACKRQNQNDGVWKKYNHVLKSNKFLHIYEHPLFRKDKLENDKLIKRVQTYPTKNSKGRKSNEAGQHDREPQNAEEGTMEKENARHSTDDQILSSAQEKMSWTFYCANDDDYSVKTKEQESDDSQTPISDDPKDASDEQRPLQTAASTDSRIKPVKDLVSPVLDRLHCLGDTVLYSITEVESAEDWDQERTLEPGVQTNSIWRPMGSIVGDPRVDMDKEKQYESPDQEGVNASPVDLSIRKYRSPVKVGTGPENGVTEDANTPTSSSDEDITDEDNLSTLAAYCQAKVSALYPTMEDVSSQPKLPVKRDVPHPEPDIIQPLFSLVRINPSPPKKIRFQPNKVKVNLSMPLNLPYGTMESQSEAKELLEKQVHTDSEIETSFNENSTDDDYCEVDEEITNSERPKLETQLMPSPNINSRSTEATGYNASQAADVKSASPAPPFIELPLCTDEVDFNITNDNPVTDMNAIEVSPPKTPKKDPSPTQERVVVEVINEPEATVIDRPIGDQESVFDSSIVTTYQFDETDSGLMPATVVVSESTLVSSTAEQIYSPQNDTGTIIYAVQTTSTPASGDTATQNVSDVQEIVSTVDTEEEQTQMLPSIDQIFMPLNTDDVGATVTISSEETTAAVAAITDDADQPPEIGRIEEVPTAEEPNEVHATVADGDQCSSQNNYSPWYNTWYRYAAYNKANYPYMPTHSHFYRWPASYPWPHYQPMSRFPAYYPSSFMNYNHYHSRQDT